MVVGPDMPPRKGIQRADEKGLDAIREGGTGS